MQSKSKLLLWRELGQNRLEQSEASWSRMPKVHRVISRVISSNVFSATPSICIALPIHCKNKMVTLTQLGLSQWREKKTVCIHDLPL